MKVLTEQQFQARLSAASLCGLEDGLQLPMQGEAAAKQVANMIRQEQPERVAGRVQFLLKKDVEVRRG